MDNLELAREMINRAIEEKKKLLKVEADIEKLNDQENTNGYWKNRWDIESQFGRIPRRSVVNENIKIARRLLLEGKV